jgi:hypothetical protein
VIALLFSTVILTTPGADIAEPSEMLAAGNTAYREGLEAQADSAKARPHFVRAAEFYESAWTNGTRTTAVARNMAQARYLAGDLGACIRNYRSGLQVFPHGAELRAGLAFARDRVQYSHMSDLVDPAKPRDVGSMLDRLPLSFVELAWTAIGIAGLGWLALARAWVGSRGGLALVGGALVLVAAFGGGWLWWEDSKQRTYWSEPTAVIASPGAELRTGNSDEYPRRLDARLPIGVETRKLGERGGWVHVELSGGVVGWIPKSYVAVVE